MVSTNSFLKEWSQADHSVVNRVVRKFLLSRKFNSSHGDNVFRSCNTFRQIDSICGFAYTSTGKCAGIFICNIQLYLDIDRKFYIYGFIKDEMGWVYALCHNNENSELIIPIGC